MLNFKEMDTATLENGIDLEYHVVESDVVNVLMLELSLQTEFFEYFMKKLNLPTKNVKLVYIGRSITERIGESDPDYQKYHGENDLVIIYLNEKSGKESAVLIEVKIDAQKMENQPERYLARCEKYCLETFNNRKEHNFERCDNVIVATKAYDDIPENKTRKYGNRILLLDIIKEYYDKKDSLTGLDKYHRTLLEKAEMKMALPDPEKHDLIIGWREYVSYLKKKHRDIHDLLVTKRREIRKENTVQFLLDNKHGHGLGHGIWEIGVSISTGNYFIHFANIKTQKAKDCLRKILENACVAAKFDGMEYTVSKDRVKAEIKTDLSFKYKELYEVSDKSINLAEVKFEDLENVQRTLREDKIPKIEESVAILKKLYTVVRYLDFEAIRDAYNNDLQ
ncbi:MAG: hypothetical protein Q4D07_03455 [Selenomonadaceae bacterium]|nr:hypothetical protein [Selenomonadaceae bacterium]